MAIRAEQAEFSRRTFIAGSVGTSLVMGIGTLLPGCMREQAAQDMADGTSKVFAPTVWFEVSGDGSVTVNVAKAEMGQHVGTALARIVADELGAAWDSIKLAHVDTDPKWGLMLTGGSWSVFTTFAMLSRAGAAGRMVLIDAGAALLGADPADCSVENGVVQSQQGSISFAEIVQRADIDRSFTDDELEAIPLLPASDRRFIGSDTRALDIPEKSSGNAVYGIDTELPGMVYATPLMPPTRYGSRIISIDDGAAHGIPGYRQTIRIDDPTGTIQGCAVVVADSFPAAEKAAQAVVVEWETGPAAGAGEADILAEGERLANDPSAGTLFVNDGDVTAARDSAAEILTSTYRTSTALHFTLEPANALVEFVDGKCHIHSGNQFQSLILPLLAQALGMPETDIVIHTYYLGGGYGRRLFGDQMIPAALAARELGRPVKLVFTRAEDSVFDCARSPSVCRFDASFDADGRLTGIEHAAAAGWPTLAMAPAFMAEGLDGSGMFDPFSINGADHWYTLPAHRVRAIENGLAQETFLPGWMRGVGPGWIAWGVECFIDEIAERAGVDPIEFRLSLLDGAGKNAGRSPESVGGALRLARVLRDVRERAGWGADLPDGEGMGVAACHGQERTMPTWIACVAHVAVDPDSRQITVRKLWQTIDCGTRVHPDGALAQAEGATLWGLSVALHEGTVLENGRVRARNLDSYTPLRMRDVPELEIHFIDSAEFPTGLGEPPSVAVAPAIGNAVYAATGIRVRDLPIRL